MLARVRISWRHIVQAQMRGTFEGSVHHVQRVHVVGALYLGGQVFDAETLANSPQHRTAHHAATANLPVNAPGAISDVLDRRDV